MPTYTTQIIQQGVNAMGFVVPEEVLAALGKGKRPPVAVTINGYTYRTTVGVMGGTAMIGIAREHRQPAGVSQNGPIEVTVELDTAPREVDVPDDLATALAEAGLRKAFDALAFSHRKEHVRAVTEAKAAETRARRVAKAVEVLRTSRGM